MCRTKIHAGYVGFKVVSCKGEGRNYDDIMLDAAAGSHKTMSHNVKNSLITAHTENNSLDNTNVNLISLHIPTYLTLMG